MKRILLSVFCCLLSVVYCPLSFSMMAQQLSEQEIIQKMSAAAEAIKTVRCDFTQTRYTKMLKEPQVSKGKMSCELPDKLRWEYTSPKASVIVMDGTNNPNQRSWRGAATLIMNSVAGKCLTDGKSFQVSAKEMPTEYVATLIPLKKDMTRMYSKLVLHFNIRLSTVTEVELHERSGDRTIIELHDIHINEE